MAAETNTRIHPDFSIEVNGLSKRFNREWIFKDLACSFHPGNTYAITGPNGSGKSTLLQVLWGQMTPSAGTLTYYKSQKAVETDDLHHHISIATPYMDLIEELTLAEHLAFHFRLRTVRDGLSVNDILEKLALESARDKAIGNFSSGMKQRVKLGLAFFTEADVIFLDEPGTNLDRQAFEWYLRMLQDVPPQVVTIIASNQPTEYPQNSVKIDILSLKPGYR